MWNIYLQVTTTMTTAREMAAIRSRRSQDASTISCTCSLCHGSWSSPRFHQLVAIRLNRKNLLSCLRLHRWMGFIYGGHLHDRCAYCYRRRLGLSIWLLGRTERCRHCNFIRSSRNICARSGFFQSSRRNGKKSALCIHVDKLSGEIGLN